jgi:predicted dehydrogenase
MVREGLTGPPVVASPRPIGTRGPDYYAVPWRGTWAGEAGGAILGHAIHAHDLLCRYFGPVAQVQAQLATRVNRDRDGGLRGDLDGIRKRRAGDVLGHTGRGAR